MYFLNALNHLPYMFNYVTIRIQVNDLEIEILRRKVTKFQETANVFNRKGREGKTSINYSHHSLIIISFSCHFYYLIPNQRELLHPLLKLELSMS